MGNERPSSILVLTGVGRELALDLLAFLASGEVGVGQPTDTLIRLIHNLFVWIARVGLIFALGYRRQGDAGKQ